MKKIALTVAGLSLILGGCASGSYDIHADYTAPMMYEGYSCRQLEVEEARLRSDAIELRGDVDQNATNDKIMTGVGVVLFWPALFFIKGNGEAASQYADLKGQHQALMQAFAFKGCADPDSPANAARANPPGPGPLGEVHRRF